MDQAVYEVSGYVLACGSGCMLSSRLVSGLWVPPLPIVLSG